MVIHMAKYFTLFPKTYYLANDDVLVYLTKLNTRFAFEETFKENTSLYYNYSVTDADTPESIAYKLYGSPERHWMVLLLNDIVDPMYDWPLNQRSLIKYIESKYSANANTANGQTGIEWSQANTKEYYKVLTKTDILSNTVVIEKFQVDANTYANVTVETALTTLADGSQVSLVTSKETKTYYDYEIQVNEAKRTIKILKPEFASAVDEEFNKVIRDAI